MTFHLITVALLVQADNEVSANAAVTEAVRACPGVVDQSIERSEPASDQVRHMVQNQLYEPGDAFADWLIFSPSEYWADEDSPAGFWSNELGWTTADAATRFSAKERPDLPMSRRGDAKLIPARCAIEAAERAVTVTVFSKANCPQCDMTKRDMDILGISYTIVDITHDDEARERFASQGFRSAPVVQAADLTWCGYQPERIKALLNYEA